MQGLVIHTRPVAPDKDASIVIENDGAFDTFSLGKGQTVTIVPDLQTRYCVGWHDIASHQNHPCENQTVVDAKYENCFVCRKKTDFNPAFYNTTALSSKQAEYNDAPHSVYVAYFGGGLAKAGITSDSRGLQRLYEQGALLYAVVDSCPNATVAHNIEDRLIRTGLKNSVTKKQKADAFLRPIDVAREQDSFKKVLENIDYGDLKICSNLDQFFYGDYIEKPVLDLGANPISGHVVAVVGRYLVLENNDLFYGYWLSNLSGYRTSFSDELLLIDHQPLQASLF